MRATGASGGPSSTYPTGLRRNPLATITANADTYPVTTTAQKMAACRARGNRCQPNTHSPSRVDSRKNATRVSTASGAPKTSPATSSRPGKWRPNWSSSTIPAAMPSA